jgi:hypothetical protein
MTFDRFNATDLATAQESPGSRIRSVSAVIAAPLMRVFLLVLITLTVNTVVRALPQPPATEQAEPTRQNADISRWHGTALRNVQGCGSGPSEEAHERSTQRRGAYVSITSARGHREALFPYVLQPNAGSQLRGASNPTCFSDLAGSCARASAVTSWPPRGPPQTTFS